ncbi:MAG: type IV pilus assembly protein PilM [Candidatus Wildermuthbacteria bacterium]|nr:type IV pilus assembly protein PilM [Candidatus Wildermuthbacteria bacterium]
MSWFSLDVVPKTFLGIDVGSSALRVVEIGGWGDRRTLKNYGEIRMRTMYKEPFRSFEKNALLLSTNDIAKALRGIFEETHMAEKKAIFSISDYSTFFTTFELPFIKEEELGSAVRFEARRHVPLPLSEVVLDWQLLEKTKDKRSRILLVAVPKEVVNYYEEIARFAGLTLIALEAEVFGNIRSYFKEEREPAVLIDIGSHTTTVSVVAKSMVRLSQTINVGGNNFTERIAQSLSVNYRKAEEEKLQKGIHLVQGNVRILVPIVDLIVTEIRKALEGFDRQSAGVVRKIVLSGGSARLPGLAEYLEKQFGKQTEVINPFHNILYPPLLEEVIKDMGPSYAVAVGMALRGFE